jgi:hypothetical protein
MDPARKPRRNGILIVFAVLVVVGAFWLVVVPHSKPYLAYKEERQLKEILQAIKPPAGTAVLTIRPMHVGDMQFAIGNYLTDSTSEAVRDHYMQEFALHAFTFKGESSPDESQTSLNFCNSGYVAELVFSKADIRPRRTYTIFLHRQGATC